MSAEGGAPEMRSDGEGSTRVDVAHGERRRLHQAERDILDGERRITAQEERVAALRAAGADAVAAEKVLATYREILEEFHAHRRLILDRLAACGATPD